MSLQTEISVKLKEAMKSGDKVVVGTLRQLKTEITTAIKNRGSTDKALVDKATDDEVLAIVKRLVKQHKESIEFFEKGGRTDAVQKEQAELSILKTFLPVMQEATEEMLVPIVDMVITATGAKTKKDIKTVMKSTMLALRESGLVADGKVLSGLVISKLQ